MGMMAVMRISKDEMTDRVSFATPNATRRAGKLSARARVNNVDQRMQNGECLLKGQTSLVQLKWLWRTDKRSQSSLIKLAACER